MDPDALGARLDAPEVLVLPGVHDPLSALVLTQMGAEAAYVGGAAFSCAQRGAHLERLGADLVFVESLESVEAYEAVRRALDAPLLANMVEGGRSPDLSVSCRAWRSRLQRRHLPRLSHPGLRRHRGRGVHGPPARRQHEGGSPHANAVRGTANWPGVGRPPGARRRRGARGTAIRRKLKHQSNNWAIARTAGAGLLQSSDRREPVGPEPAVNGCARVRRTTSSIPPPA